MEDPVVWRDWHEWEAAELLASGEELARLHGELLTRGESRTRHYNPAEELTAFVRWTWGASDYAALQSREDFLRECPEEAVVMDYFESRGKRVECALARIDGALRDQAGGDGPSILLRHRYFALLTQLRHRCSLGTGYLVQLDGYLLEHLERLCLFDRHLGALRRGAAGPLPLRTVPAELAEFDRRLEGVRLGARGL